MIGNDAATKFNLIFKVNWETHAIPLSRCRTKAKELGRPGVYYLFRATEGRDDVTSPYDDRVFYIGKSHTSVASRAVKHFESINGSIRKTSGKRASNTGRNLAAYARIELKMDCEHVHLRYGIVDPAYVGCAEELLLLGYVEKHRRLPRGNTQDFGALSALAEECDAPTSLGQRKTETPSAEAVHHFVEELQVAASIGFTVKSRRDGVVVVTGENGTRLEMRILKTDVRFAFRPTDDHPLTGAGRRSRAEALQYAVELLRSTGS